MTSTVEHTAGPKIYKASYSIFPIVLICKIKHSKKYNPENEYSSQHGTKINKLSGPSWTPARFSLKPACTWFMFKVNYFNLIKIKNLFAQPYLLLRAY